MSKENLRKNKVGSSLKDFSLIMFLLVNSLIWFVMMRRSIYWALDKFEMTLEQNIILWGFFDLAIILSGITGAILSYKVGRPRLICSWLFFGVISTISFYFVQFLPPLYFFLASLVWGISFGLGMSPCLAYFADLTSFNNRGFIGGLIFFIANALSSLVITFSLNFGLCTLIAAIWRASSLLILFLIPLKTKDSFKKYAAFSLIIDRKFLLYFVPWFMFSLIFSLQKIVAEHFLETDFYDFLRAVEAAFATISVITAGKLCDNVGRKRVVIYGFVSLGIAYAIVGIFPASFISWFIFSVIDGIAWGIFFLIFFLVLWGDLASSIGYSGEKYYALGSIPFFFADFMGSLFIPFVKIPVNTIFSVASFFLFLAVIPLMYAPETLPEKLIRRKELKEYIEKARKIREKYEKKEP